MSVLNYLKRINRKHWFICHACLMQTNHDPLRSLFFHNTPGEDFLGRMMYPCPRCSSTNTRSFQQLKEEGSEQALFGLEGIVRKHPRSTFQVKPGKERNAG
jgi:hypothetical protein